MIVAVAPPLLLTVAFVSSVVPAKNATVPVGRPAPGDGTETVADSVVRALAAEDFLILPHPEVLTYMRNKTADYNRWIGGMRKLNRRFRG